MKPRQVRWTALAVALAMGGCALGYANDPRFQNWLAQAEAFCTPRYGALPLDTAEQRAQFEQLSYQTFYKNLPREVYADRLHILYPDHGLMVGCLATAFPQR